MHNLGNQIRITWTQAQPSTATTTLGSFYAQPNATGLINVTGTHTSAGLADAVLSVVPTQFHFHTTSEHTLEGRFSALELHLVANVTGANTSCANTCTAVYAVLYDLSADGISGAEASATAPLLCQLCTACRDVCVSQYVCHEIHVLQLFAFVIAWHAQ